MSAYRVWHTPAMCVVRSLHLRMMHVHWSAGPHVQLLFSHPRSLALTEPLHPPGCLFPVHPRLCWAQQIWAQCLLCPCARNHSFQLRLSEDSTAQTSFLWPPIQALAHPVTTVWSYVSELWVTCPLPYHTPCLLGMEALFKRISNVAVLSHIPSRVTLF